MKRFLFVVLLFYSAFTFAQKHDYVWTFGYSDAFPYLGGSNINFNFTPPDTDYVKRDINFKWDCASVCDSQGKLLFMANGCKIFNGKNKMVKNGTGLNPGKTSTDYCNLGNLMTQGSLFLPHPTDTSLYYLFHLRPEYVEKDFLGGIGDKIYYTLLNKTGDNGNGEVLSKNNVIHEDTLAFGKMTAVKHGNGRDWWILVPRMLQNRYIKLLFTSTGIKGPFFQNIGLKNNDDDGTGQAVFSPDGTKYIHFDRYNDLSIFDFDRCSGELSNFKRILLPIARDTIIIKGEKYPKYTIGGVAVSPNSKYLYVTTEANVYQYNLKAIKIEESAKLVAQYDTFSINGLVTSFLFPHIAPDNKIYINCASAAPVMHVINNPNEEGLTCNLTQHSFRLPTYNAFSIPNFPNFRLGKIDKPMCETPIATKNGMNEVSFKIFPNPTSGYITIISEELPNTQCTWALFDAQGRYLFSQLLDSEKESFNLPAELPQGIYFWRILNNTQQLAQGKLVLVE